MISVKVTYQSTIRCFSVPNTISWLDLKTKLREIFSLPSTLKISLAYTDEEGDVITLSTDLELQEILSSQSPLKFILVPEKQPSFDINSENVFVSVNKEKFTPDDISLKADKHVIVVDEVNEPSFEPTIPSISKGKQKEESTAESSTFTTDNQQREEQSSTSNDERRAPFIEVAEQFQGLLDQFKDVISKNPQVVEQANNVMDQILQNVPVDINQWAQWLNTFRPPEGDTSTTDAQGDETNDPRSEQQQQKQNDGFNQFHSWIQRAIQDARNNYSSNFENFTGFNGRPPWNFNGGCPFRMQQRQQQQEPREGLSQEELKEKIDLLHLMGFWEDDVKNEELLNKYNGNMEKVIEILIKQQTERINNNYYNSMEGAVGGL